MPPCVSTGDRDAVLRQIRWRAAVQTLVNCHCLLVFRLCADRLRVPNSGRRLMLSRPCHVLLVRCLLNRVPSVLRRCWLGHRKGIRPVKTERWCAGMVMCLERGADLHITWLMPLPLTVSCFSKIQIGFTFLLPAHRGSRGQRAVKRVCVCSCSCYLLNSSLASIVGGSF